MGQRGPVRDPNSRRGRAEIAKKQRLAVRGSKPGPEQDNPVSIPPNIATCDKCLPRRVQELYGNLVTELVAAKVDVRSIDSYAVTQAARILYAIESAESLGDNKDATPEVQLSALRLGSSLAKDLLQWLNAIGATPASRSRAGVKPEPVKKSGPLAQLLAARQAQMNDRH